MPIPSKPSMHRVHQLPLILHHICSSPFKPYTSIHPCLFHHILFVAMPHTSMHAPILHPATFSLSTPHAHHACRSFIDPHRLISPIPCMHPWPSSPLLRTHIHPSYTTTPAAIAHPLFIPITTHAHPSIKHTHLTHFFILHTHFYYHHSLSTPPCTMSSLSLH